MDEKDVAHLRAEQRVLRGVQHPFIVALHYAFHTEDRLYLVMVYEKLNDNINNSQLNLKKKKKRKREGERQRRMK